MIIHIIGRIITSVQFKIPWPSNLVSDTFQTSLSADHSSVYLHMKLLNLHLYITKYICNYMQNYVLYLNVYFKAALDCVTLRMEI